MLTYIMNNSQIKWIALQNLKVEKIYTISRPKNSKIFAPYNTNIQIKKQTRSSHNHTTFILHHFMDISTKATLFDPEYLLLVISNHVGMRKLHMHRTLFTSSVYRYAWRCNRNTNTEKMSKTTNHEGQCPTFLFPCYMNSSIQESHSTALLKTQQKRWKEETEKKTCGKEEGS